MHGCRTRETMSCIILGGTWYMAQTVAHLPYTRVYQVQIWAVTKGFFALLRSLQAKVTKLHRRSDKC